MEGHFAKRNIKSNIYMMKTKDYRENLFLYL